MTPQLKRVLGVALFAALFLWGSYTLLMYLSVNVHQQVLLSEVQRDTVRQACEGSGALCQGWHAFFPFLIHTIAWASPFLWYAVVSVLLYGAFIVWHFLQSGEWSVQLRLRPWTMILLFLGSLFLMFNVLVLGHEGDVPMRRIVEPLPQVYNNITPETLATLQENFRELQESNCLKHIGQSVSGAQVYDVRLVCAEKAFFLRVLPQVLLVLLFLFELLVLGRLVTSLLRLQPRHPLVETMVSIGLGAGSLIAILWSLALLHLYTQTAGWILAATIPIVGWRQACTWLRRLFRTEWQGKYMWYSVTLLLGWLLLSYLAFNFLTVVRPFPIGWDDLGRYLNHPRQLVSYGHFIPQMGTFQWEYLTSLGFLLIGYDVVAGATFSMMINWTAGLLAVLSVYAFGLVFLGPKRGLLAALLYYTLPLVGHFSFADMKIDNAVFTMGALSTLTFFLMFFPTHAEQEENDGLEVTPRRDWRWLALAGVFGGLSFGMKPTAVMVLMSLATILTGIGIHWSVFPGAALLGWAFYTWHTEFNPQAVSQYVYGDPSVIGKGSVYIFCIGLGLLFFAIGVLRNRRAFLPTMRMVGIFIAGIFVSMLPWLIYNNIQHGHFPPILELGTPDRISPVFLIEARDIPAGEEQHVHVLPPELRPDLKHPACQSTSKAEEVDRYWGGGYGKGWRHYLTLPWRTVMNLDSAGYYVTTIPVLLLFPLLLLLPFFWRKTARPLRWLFLATVFQVVQWMFFANGIPWYGVGMFFGLTIGLEALVFHAPNASTKWLAGIFITLSLFIGFAMRFWQFDQQRNLLEYPMGKISAEGIRKRTIPYYDLIRDVILQRHESMPNRPFVYRIGTFIPYFIPRSMENLPMTDNQLDFFNCLHQERDPALTLARLKALGFSSILFDTNTHTIERDPNGTLHKKVQAFIDFLNTPSLGLQILVNNTDAGVAFVVIP